MSHQFANGKIAREKVYEFIVNGGGRRSFDEIGLLLYGTEWLCIDSHKGGIVSGTRRMLRVMVRNKAIIITDKIISLR